MKKTTLLVAILILGGCQTLNNLGNQIKKPSLAVEDVRVSSFSFDELSLVYDIKVNNPNATSFNMTGYNYQLDINGSEFVAGDQAQKMRINADSESIVEVPVTVNFNKLYRAIKGIASRDESNYRMLSNLRFNIPGFGQTEIPIKKEGTIPMVKMPLIQFQDISVESISFSGANVSVDFTVDNPNDFGLKINTLDYNLTIEGDRWVSGNALEDTRIKANAVSELKIPVSLDMGKVGMSAYRILSASGSVDYRVDGTMSVNALHELLGTAEIPFDRSGSVTIGR